LNTRWIDGNETWVRLRVMTSRLL